MKELAIKQFNKLLFYMLYKTELYDKDLGWT